MKVIYISNFFNHHQKYLSDVLYRYFGDGYHFIETAQLAEEQAKLGYHSYDEPYLLQYNDQTKAEIDRMVMDADVVQFGEAPLSMIKARIRKGKLVLRDNERRYKSLSRYLKWPVYTYNSLYFNRGYILAASAFAPRDHLLSGMKPNRCFKWGYFPEVKHYGDIESVFERKKIYRDKQKIDISILWASRLIRWKHPESVIRVAEMLRNEGVRFELNIIGAGPMEDVIKKLIEKKSLSSSVHFLGAMSPESVREKMELSDIFLSTSDQNEGWGATVNESMNSACAVVAGHMIGSVPFLIKNNQNGLIFKNKDWNSLCEKVKFLADNPGIMKILGTNAYRTMTEEWSPEVAGNNLIKLYEALLAGKDTPIKEGPCSRAEILCSNWLEKIQ